MSRGRPTDSFEPLRRRLHVEDWPESDQHALRTALAPAAPLEPEHPAADWPAETRRTRLGAYGQFLAWLDHRGALDPDAPPASRLTPERVGGWIADRRRLVSPRTLAQTLRELQFFAMAVFPGQDWSWIRRHPAAPTAAEIRAARRPRPVPPAPARIVLTLLDDLNRLASLSPGIRTAQLWRDDLILLFAAAVPIRRRNLASLRIGQHLLIDGDRLFLAIEGQETKTGQGLNLALPRVLRRILIPYLETYRPILLGVQDSNHLWINRKGLPLDYSAFYMLFQRAGERLLGLPLTPHLLRHGTATAILLEDPAATRHAADLLGHRNTGTVDSVYDLSGSAASVLRLHHCQAALRGRMMKPEAYQREETDDDR